MHCNLFKSNPFKLLRKAYLIPNILSNFELTPVEDKFPMVVTLFFFLSRSQAFELPQFQAYILLIQNPQ